MNGIVRKWREHVLCSTDMDKRLRGIEVLAESDDKEAVPLIVSALDDPDSEVRAHAANALNAIGDPRATESLIQRVLIEREHNALEYATVALANLARDAGIAALSKVLDDENPSKRLAAARALRRVGWDRVPDAVRARVAILQDDWDEVSSYGPIAIDAIHQVLRSGTPTARRRAAESLGRIGGKRALAALIDVMKAEDLSACHRETAAWGIRRVCWDDADDTDLALAAIVQRDWFGVVSFGPVAVGPLVDILAIKDRELTEGVVHALNDIESEVALAALIQTLRDIEQDLSTRQLIATLFGKRNDCRSLVALVSLLSDESWLIRTAALEALEQRHWQPTLTEEKALVSILRKDWDQIHTFGESAIPALAGSLGFYSVGSDAAKALLALGTPGCDALVHELNHATDNPAIREVASMALANCGDARAIKPLQAMLNDRDIAVRQFAVWTLERLGWEPSTKSEEAISALAHGDWEHLRGLGASAVEPLLHMAADSMAQEETMATLDHILDVAPGRISIRQLQELVGLDEITQELETVTHGPRSVRLKDLDEAGRVSKRAHRELLRRGILQ